MRSVCLPAYDILGLTVGLSVRAFGVFFVAVPTLYQYVKMFCDRMSYCYSFVC